jgi:hypothetical protein
MLRYIIFNFFKKTKKQTQVDLIERMNLVEQEADFLLLRLKVKEIIDRIISE